jgi:Protein of unknown function (DUF1566)
MKWQASVVLILLSIVTTIAGAQSPTEGRGQAQETQVRGYWIDPSTGLMWAGKDNGKDVNWDKARKYCRNLRLAGYSDWRLATIDELKGIYDKNAKAPGLGGKHGDQPFAFHVKGNLFLTGQQWSSTQRRDDSGRPIGFAWFFDFLNSTSWRDPDDHEKCALCVRRSGE